MNFQLIDIVVMLAILGIAFIALYKLISLINSRPDLIAFVGLTVIIFGGVGVVSGSAEIVGGYMMLGGALSFLLSAMIYRSNNKKQPVLSTPPRPIKSTLSAPAQPIDLTKLSRDELIHALTQLGGGK